MTVPSIVAAAQSLAPAVHAAADEAERTRQTPPALAAALTEAGIYQMYLPRSVGARRRRRWLRSVWSRNCRKPMARWAGAP